MVTTFATEEKVKEQAPTAPQYVHTKENFTDIYNKLRDDILNDDILKKAPTASQQWVHKMLDYNCPGGKLNRGMAVYDTARSILGEKIDQKTAYQANVMGWCIEFLQAFFLVADDIMDHSITRRGQPCWYKRPEVQLTACNDYIIIEQCLYKLLRTHIRSNPYYAEILDLFLEVTFKTSIGQLLDLLTASQQEGKEIDLNIFNLQTYTQIVQWKTAYYSFYLPVASGLILCGIADKQQQQVAEKILIQMGEYFQIQDDFLDCFGTYEEIGKQGTDIEDAKCSWLACQAVIHTNEQQKQVFKAHYGKNNPEDVQKIKELYKEIGLDQLFYSYEQESYNELLALINSQDQLPKEIFILFLKKIYKRKK